MSFLDRILMNLPEVQGPKQKKLSFKQKLKWTGIILFIFFILGMIPLFGLDPQNQFRFEQLEVLLGAKFGSIISLGIGPIVTASIVLQLLNGSGIVKFDLTSPEGKRRFQASGYIHDQPWETAKGINYVQGLNSVQVQLLASEVLPWQLDVVDILHPERGAGYVYSIIPKRLSQRRDSHAIRYEES